MDDVDFFDDPDYAKCKMFLQDPVFGCYLVSSMSHCITQF